MIVSSFQPFVIDMNPRISLAKESSSMIHAKQNKLLSRSPLKLPFWIFHEPGAALGPSPVD
jgi:hypothetical protein